MGASQPVEAALPTGKIGQRPRFVWDKDWKRVEHDLVAVALDNRWAHGLSKEQIMGDLPLSGWASLVQNAPAMVAGLDWMDGGDFHAYLHAKNGDAAAQLLTTIKDFISEFSEMRRDPDPPQKAIPERTFQMEKGLWEHTHIRRRESTIRVHTTAKLSMSEFVQKMIIDPVVQSQR